jgi:hypothetical protein
MLTNAPTTEHDTDAPKAARRQRVRFEVSFIRPPAATVQQAREYVHSAVHEMRGALQPPGRDEGGDNPEAQGDPMFLLEPETIQVQDKNAASKRTRGGKLLEAFDEAAQVWGYQSDQGVGSAVKRAEKHYNACKAALVAYLRRIERRA